MKQVQIQVKRPVRKNETDEEDVVWDPILRKFVYKDIWAEVLWRHTS